MNKVKVSLISLGNLKYPIDINYLEKRKSSIMNIVHGASIGQIPDAEGDDWEYTKEQLSDLIHADNEADFTVALINAPIEDNYYMRRIGNDIAVVSLFEMADIMKYSDFKIEDYILRNIYELVVLYAANGKLIPSDSSTWAHDEVRGCLFDMNANKSDIIFSMHKPILCQSCKSRVLTKQLMSGFLPALDSELKKIKKSLYFQIAEWVKEHPIYALAITACTGILMNIVATIIFEKAKKVLPWLG